MQSKKDFKTVILIIMITALFTVKKKMIVRTTRNDHDNSFLAGTGITMVIRTCIMLRTTMIIPVIPGNRNDQE